MSVFTLERSAELIGEVSLSLRAWDAHANDDNVHIQHMRRSEIIWASRLLYDIVYDVRQHRQEVQLTVGEEPIEAIVLSKTNYGFFDERPEDVEPREELRFKRAENLGFGAERELYLGDYSLLIATSALAATLRCGSLLEIVPFADDRASRI